MTLGRCLLSIFCSRGTLPESFICLELIHRMVSGIKFATRPGRTGQKSVWCEVSGDNIASTCTQHVWASAFERSHGFWGVESFRMKLSGWDFIQICNTSIRHIFICNTSMRHIGEAPSEASSQCPPPPTLSWILSDSNDVAKSTSTTTIDSHKAGFARMFDQIRWLSRRIYTEQLSIMSAHIKWSDLHSPEYNSGSHDC